MWRHWFGYSESVTRSTSKTANVVFARDQFMVHLFVFIGCMAAATGIKRAYEISIKKDPRHVMDFDSTYVVGSQRGVIIEWMFTRVQCNVFNVMSTCLTSLVVSLMIRWHIEMGRMKFLRPCSHYKITFTRSIEWYIMSCQIETILLSRAYRCMRFSLKNHKTKFVWAFQTIY